MADPAKTVDQNILPVQALFNIDNSFNTFIGQGQPFIVSATESIGIQDVPTLDATLYLTLSPVSTGQVTSLDVASTKLTFNPSTSTLSVPFVSGALKGTADAATNIANGSTGQIPYQTSANVTGFISNGTSGQVLTSNGSSAPSWSTPTFLIPITDDTTTNAVRYPLFSAATSGNITVEYTSSTKYQFNPSTGVLTATGFSGSGAALTSLTAANLSGTIPSAVLGNSNVYIGTTAIALNRTSASINLTGTSIDGSADSANTATTATNATNIAITDNTSSVLTYYPVISSATTGNVGATTSSTKFSFVPSTGTLRVSALSLTNALPIASGGTNGTSTPTSGAVAYGTGTAYAFTSAGTTGQVLTSQGSSAPIWTTAGTGTVTSVGGTGTVNGLTLTGTVTSSGNLTLGGTLDLSSPPAIGSTTASTGAFTTLSASSTVSGTGFSTYLASPPAIGGTTPAAGTFTTLIGGGGSANYGQVTGGATTKAVQFQTLGSDTNISQVFQSKGTGAIDLAAGSSGVNISNGGTVTAITRTATGSGYTSKPTVAITAPTTAGGVQAAVSVFQMFVGGYTVAAGGTGYTVGDILTVVGGTQSGGAATLTVATVSAGAVVTVTISNAAAYSVLPTNPVSVTGGTGSGATFNLTWSPINFTIDNAGSGYVEQPTVTFSGGGGSGAAAYATVGATATIKGLYGGASAVPLQFSGPSGALLQIMESGNTSAPTALIVKGGGSSTQQYPSVSNASIQFSSNGTGIVQFYTNTLSTEQLRVSHTASAVNYVQVTGAATGGTVNISSQGSDAGIPLVLQAKASLIRFLTGNGFENFRVNSVNSSANYLAASGAIAGASPFFAAQGTDTDINLTLTPKGTGAVKTTANAYVGSNLYIAP